MMNRLLMEKVRSMFNGVGLGQELWVVTIDTICYFKNRSPALTLVDKTPHEVWSGKKPSIAHLIFLGVTLLCMFQRRKGARWIIK